MKGYDFVLRVVTFVGSFLSGIGSLLVLVSYWLATTKARPKAAQLIRNLAFADLIWNFMAFIESVFWIASPDDPDPVPIGVCYVASFGVNFLRMASLMWTCAISFDVLMSLQKRKWLYDSEEQGWMSYRKTYYTVIILVSLPGAVINSIVQLGYNREGDRDPTFGCKPGHEPGTTYGLDTAIALLELIPIFIAFIFNLVVYCKVSNVMGQKAYPQSVRKRRRRVMYHYILVCTVCWAPTIALYMLEILFYNSVSANILQYIIVVARASIYLTGFLNFIVFGMQDPHLKKSFDVAVHSVAVFFGFATEDNSYHTYDLKSHDVVKSVMFEESTINKNADISKDKRHIYRKNRLSREDKEILYRDRPDLEPVMSPPAVNKGSGGGGGNSPTSQRSSSPKSVLKVTPQGSGVLSTSPRSNQGGGFNIENNKVLSTSPRTHQDNKIIGFTATTTGNSSGSNSGSSGSSENSSDSRSQPKTAAGDLSGGNASSSTNSNTTHRGASNTNFNTNGGGISDDINQKDHGDSLAIVINGAISSVLHSSNNIDNNSSSSSSSSSGYDYEDDDNNENDESESGLDQPLLQKSKFGKGGNIEGKYIKKENKTLSLSIPTDNFDRGSYDSSDRSNGSIGSSSNRSRGGSSGHLSDSSSEDEKDDEDHELAQPVQARFSPRNNSNGGGGNHF